MSVNGTNIETNVDGTGLFTLDGVPAGTIVLNFTGRGVNASVELRGVSTGERIEIDVRLEGSGARVESESRQGGEGDDGDDDDHALPDGVIEIEGDVSSLGGACPALTFRLGSQMVRTTSATIFEHTTCSAIQNASHLEVQGRRQADGSLLATGVEGP